LLIKDYYSHDVEPKILLRGSKHPLIVRELWFEQALNLSSKNSCSYLWYALFQCGISLISSYLIHAHCYGMFNSKSVPRSLFSNISLIYSPDILVIIYELGWTCSSLRDFEFIKTKQLGEHHGTPGRWYNRIIKVGPAANKTTGLFTQFQLIILSLFVSLKRIAF
jgi:hypothetical protein